MKFRTDIKKGIKHKNSNLIIPVSDLLLLMKGSLSLGTVSFGSSSWKKKHKEYKKSLICYEIILYMKKMCIFCHDLLHKSYEESPNCEYKPNIHWKKNNLHEQRAYAFLQFSDKAENDIFAHVSSSIFLLPWLSIQKLLIYEES